MYTVAIMVEGAEHGLNEYRTSEFINGHLDFISPVFSSITKALQWARNTFSGREYKIIEVEVMG